MYRGLPAIVVLGGEPDFLACISRDLPTNGTAGLIPKMKGKVKNVNIASKYTNNLQLHKKWKKIERIHKNKESNQQTYLTPGP